MYIYTYRYRYRYRYMMFHNLVINGLSSANETLRLPDPEVCFGLKICSKRLHHLHDANGMMPTGCCRDTQTNSAGPEFNSAMGQMTQP